MIYFSSTVDVSSSDAAVSTVKEKKRIPSEAEYMRNDLLDQVNAVERINTTSVDCLQASSSNVLPEESNRT